MHPLILSWPSAAFYNKAIRSGLADPLAQRPIVEGIPWQQVQPWDERRLRALAASANATTDDMETLPRDLQPPPQHSEERHRFLLVDNPSVE
eukprot:364658-Pyramimonas_sp.AAC.1